MSIITAQVNTVFFGRTGDDMNKDVQVQSKALLAKKYYDGDHTEALMGRQQAWLKQHGNLTIFSVNFCRTIIDVTEERLRITGFSVNVSEDDGKKIEPNELELAYQKILWGWWSDNNMGIISSMAHSDAMIKKEAFIISEWDGENNRPIYTLHDMFISKEAGGDETGVYMVYEDSAGISRPKYAVYRFNDFDPSGQLRKRKNVYYPDRCEKFFYFWDNWAQMKDDPLEPWPIPWKLKNGKPIGIPVFHIQNVGKASDLDDVIHLQDAYNKIWVDILAGSDASAFRIVIVLGAIPTSDGQPMKDDKSNLMYLVPGQMWATEASPDRVKIETIEPVNLGAILEAEERLIERISIVSKIPTSRIVLTGAVASEQTQKQYDAPLIEKATKRMEFFEVGWKRLGEVSFRMAKVFGKMTSVPDDVSVDVIWAPAETRPEETLVDLAEKKAKMPIPFEVLAKELGYTDAQIEAFKKSPEYKAYIANLNLAIIASTQAALSPQSQVEDSVNQSNNDNNDKPKEDDQNQPEEVNA